MSIINYILEPIGSFEILDKDTHGIAKCSVCGKAYLSTGSPSCSKKCRRKRTNIKYRANRHGAILDYSITLLLVWEKFNGICTDCNKKTVHPNNIKYRNILKPSIEHILPLAMGGNHIWDNITLLCLKCNGLRNKIMLSIK